MKKVLIIDPYINTLGGGEKYLFDMVGIFNKYGYKITLHCKGDAIIDQIRQRFNIKLLNVNTIDFYRLNKPAKFNLLRSFEKVIYVTDGSYFYSLAKKNYLLAMYPKKELYISTISNQLKWRNWQFFCFSSFTKKYIDQWTGKKSNIIYPKIDDNFLKMKNIPKKNIILSVGRFFGHLHNKNHIFLIDSFNKLQQNPEFKKFDLILAGGLTKE